jgi:NADH:ubiquinone oxidoreductase subunit E
MTKKIRVVICSGTACYVMGASDLLLLEDSLGEDMKNLVEIEGSPCLGFCKNHKNGKAPFVTIDGEVLSSATIPDVIAKIQELTDVEYQ